jgi:predicted LPLAT superfamily acyltransferase
MKEHSYDYHFYASPSKIYTGSKEISMENMLNDYCRSMEESILKYPLQWYNYYDFWEDGATV